MGFQKEGNKMDIESGELTYLTTKSACLDFFAALITLRSKSEADIKERLDRAWAENSDLTLRMLFFARDILGGLGERFVFCQILRFMAIDRQSSVVKNLWAIPEFGCFADLFCLLDTPVSLDVTNYIRNQFEADMAALEKNKPVSLLGKYLPSIYAQNEDADRHCKFIIQSLALTETEYNNSLTKLRSEIDMIENGTYEKYYAFGNLGSRYKSFLSKIEYCESKLNIDSLLPSEIIRPVFGNIHGYITAYIIDSERQSMDKIWKAQNDFTYGKNFLAVIDCSGSMWTEYNINDPTPISIALSLGIYFAERNKGLFQNHFIPFSETPKLMEITGSDIYDKVKHIVSFNELANTNIQRLFELILDTAVKNNLSQSEMPDVLYIISDMEFTTCVNGAGSANFEYAKTEFERHGYILPEVVFWNVTGFDVQPISRNENGVVLVSGVSPLVLSMVLSGNLSPYSFMIETLYSKRYDKISV